MKYAKIYNNLFSVTCFNLNTANPASNRLGMYQLKHQVKRDKELREKLRPNYPFGCKRFGISNKYFPTLESPHVSVISSEIVKVTDNSIVSEDGREEEIDVSQNKTFSSLRSSIILHIVPS